MRYKVYNVTEDRFVTDEHPCWMLKPDGSLKINDYGDEVKDLNCIPLFFSTESDGYYTDDIGGIHCVVAGVRPNGSVCNECNCVSCSICELWKLESE